MARDFKSALDHLLLGAPTLESGIAWLAERTGVRAVPGGSHPGLGTWNAIASLGPAQYVEIIAPDPDQEGVETFYVPGLRDFEGPRIATWAARADDLRSRFGESLPPGFTCEPSRSGSRIRPDGSRLAWSLAFPRHIHHGVFSGAWPFFIEWEDAALHPGRSTPAGLGLRAMSIAHPAANVLAAGFQAFGIDPGLIESATARIRVELDTPRGVVVL